MRKHKWASFACVIIAVFSIAAEMPLIVHASLTNDYIKESEESKKQAEQNRNTLKSGLTDIQALLKSLEGAKSNLQNYITQLDANLNDLNAKIEELNTMISEKEADIKETQAALEKAQEIEEAQYSAMKQRVRFMYEKGSGSYMEMLFSSESFTDFLNKAEFINKISEYDRKMLEQYMETKEEIALAKERLEQEQQELEEANDALATEQGAVETLISSKEEEITVYESDIQNKEVAVAQYKAEIAAQDQLIKDLEAAILAEKKRLLEENKAAITYDGGQFAWPAPKYTRISDDYGNRIHPTLGVQQFHNGVDMAAPAGSPILSAYDGEVVAASYSSTMGNYIMVDHGDGLYTIYMHASSLGVSQGQMVARGEQIATVGSTGRSTGNHLHFSVRLNGSYVSPWNYLQ